MNYIVLDLEWNQPLDMRNPLREPLTLYGEIIEIGAVKLSEALEELGSFKMLVRPKHYTKMNHRVYNLTGISDEELAGGLPFPEAFERFRSWCGSDIVFLTWGPNDIDILKDNMTLHGLDSSLISRAYDAQRIFDRQVTREKRQISLTDALERLYGSPGSASIAQGCVDSANAVQGSIGSANIAPADPEGKAPLGPEPAAARADETYAHEMLHDALYDAKCAAKICQRLDIAAGISEYEKHRKQPAKRKPGRRFYKRRSGPEKPGQGGNDG